MGGFKAQAILNQQHLNKVENMSFDTRGRGGGLLTGRWTVKTVSVRCVEVGESQTIKVISVISDTAAAVAVLITDKNLCAAAL